MGRRRIRIAAGVGTVLLALAVTSASMASRSGSAELVAVARASTVSPPRPTTTTSALPTTTVEPTTTAPPPPPDTTPPPAPAPPPVPIAAPVTRPPTTAKGKISVLVVGDSLGFTAAFPPPTASERPDYISAIIPAAVPSCGLLWVAGFTPVDVEHDGPDYFGLCSTQAAREALSLANRTNWMVLFSGGWEHLPWIPPGSTTPFAARSPEMRQAILNELVRRGNAAIAVGTRTAFVAWVCPAGVTPTRSGDYVTWYDDILRAAARIVPGALVVEPTDRVCVGGNAAGQPTPEKDAAFKGGYHPEDKRWLWREWIGPILYANS